MIRYGIIFKILGLLLMLFSASYVFPILISLIYADGKIPVFFYAFLITFSLGALIWIPCARFNEELRARDGFMITVLFWTVLSLAGALPFVLSAAPQISFTDAVFESVSGLTTTGATVISGLDNLPKSLLFYRQLMQWMGGIGIVVVAVAILPMLGIGGMQLYRAETPGPVKDSKLTPRIAETAKALFFIYLTITVCCATLYWIGGMSLFDSITHSFSTVSTGGFSTHDESMGWFLKQPDINGDFILIVCMAFMVIAAINFGLHYYAFARLSLWHYFKDTEAKVFLVLIIAGMIVITSGLIIWETFDVTKSIRHGFFQTISIMTSAGYTTDNFSVWPQHLAFFMIILSFFGGCAGSTAGGIKISRMVILGKQTLREIYRLIHPNAVFPIKMGARPVNPRIADAIWGFFGAYLIVYYVMVVILLATGLDYVTAWSAVAATINNLGPGLGDVGLNFAGLNDFAKWVLCACMILGRLELFTLIVLCVPMYWRS